MLTEIDERHSLRVAINAQLPTDPDLDAFCVDYFPKVHRRFNSAMDRIAKVNLLFTLVEQQEVADKLRLYAEPDLRRVSRHQWGQRALWVAVAVAVAVAVVGGWIELRRKEGTRSLPAARESSQPSIPTRIPGGGINSDNSIVVSPRAQMHNVVSGDKASGDKASSQGPARSANSGNRIEGSAGAVMRNEVKSP